MKHKQIAEYCKNNLNLANARLGEEYYYQSLPLCVIDAVFSIGIKYGTTKNVIINFCNKQGIARFRTYGSDFPTHENQLSVSDFLDIYKLNAISKITEEYFNNRCRTSPRNGILKSVATKQFCEVLKECKVNYLQDIRGIIGNTDFEQKIKKIPGQRSGISTTYFYMLAGEKDYIKPDRMVVRFVETVTGISFSCIEDVTNLIKEAHAELVRDYPSLSLRELDHEIWKYQKGSGKNI